MGKPVMGKPSVDPARWTPPEAAPLGRPVAPGGLRVLDTSGYGTEDVLVRDDGKILTGLEDGRIVAIDAESGTETLVADTDGRPLGIEHHPAGGTSSVTRLVGSCGWPPMAR